MTDQSADAIPLFVPVTRYMWSALDGSLQGHVLDQTGALAHASCLTADAPEGELQPGHAWVRVGGAAGSWEQVPEVRGTYINEAGDVITLRLLTDAVPEGYSRAAVQIGGAA